MTESRRVSIVSLRLNKYRFALFSNRDRYSNIILNKKVNE